MNESGGLGRVATHGLAGRPNVEIDAQRQSLRCDSEQCQRLDHGRTCRSDDGCGPQDCRFSHATFPTETTPVTDVAKGHQLAAGNVNQARQTQDSGRCHCNEAGSAGPYRVHQVKRRRAVLSADRADRAKSRVGSTYVVDTRTEQVPSRGQSFLAQSEHVDLIVHRKACDQGQQRRDDPVLAGSVHPSGHDEGDLHGLSRLPAKPVGPGGNSAFRASTACSGCCPRASSNAGSRHTRWVKTLHPGCFAAYRWLAASF